MDIHKKINISFKVHKSKSNKTLRRIDGAAVLICIYRTQVSCRYPKKKLKKITRCN